MSKYLGSLIVVLTGVACGGTTETGDQPSGGSSAGGASTGGHSSAGSAGKATGGSVGTGGGVGTGGSVATAGVSTGGSIVVAGAGGAISTGGVGGSAMVDSRCPARRPTPPGACTADMAGAACQYDFTGCLCYPLPPGSFALCQKVNPACTTDPGLPPVPPPAEQGAGGISAKIALPPQEVCRCTAGTWACGFGP